MPILSNFIAKIVSLCFFVSTTAIKVVSIVVLSGLADSICLSGGHLSDEAAMHLELVTISLIPDIIMVVCISVGITSKSCNMGADPASIIYNFVVGFITISAMIPFFKVTDCKSDDFSKIKSVGLFTPIGGFLHIINAVLGFLSLSVEESSPPVRHNRNALDARPSTSAGPAKSATPAKPAKPAKPAQPVKPAKSAKQTKV